MNTAKTFLFIVGRGRSGTTLLSRILNTHPQIAVAPESLFIMSLYGKYASVRSWDEEILQSFCDDLWLDDRFALWTLDRRRLKEDLISACRHGTNTYAAFCWLVYLAHATGIGKPNPAVVCDKNPHYSLFVDKLTSLYPSAKYLHILRDYRSNVLSYKGVRFDAQQISVLAYRWKKYNQEILRYCRLRGNQFLQVRFEDLLADFKNTVATICHFLGVDYEPQISEFYKHAGSTAPWHANLKKKIQTDKIDEWREALPDREIAIAEAICGDFAEQFGYEPLYSPSQRHLLLTEWPKLLYASLLTRMERVLFSLPLWLRSFIIKRYRIMTGSYAG
ncbi:MAG: sulfotransferase [Candidatus Hodarchaeota archaeon]